MTLPKRILVPTDFSESSTRAVDQAFELAQALGAKVSLVHAYGIPSIPEGALVGTVIDELTKAANTEFAAEVAKYNGSPSLGDAFVRMGDPRDVIVRAARELQIDMIVMGSHGRRGLSRFVLGSVAESVVRTAPCAVLVVHGPESATKEKSKQA